MNNQLAVSLTDPKTLSAFDNRLELEQEGVDEDVSLRDVYQMWLLARSGVSARTYKPYKGQIKINETSITFKLGFYVWTLPGGLSYDLETTLGTITEAEVFEKERDITVVFGVSDQFDLGRKASHIEHEWLTPLIDRFGKTHRTQKPEYRNGSLFLDDSYFGSARIQFVEHGYRHEVEVTIENVDEDGTFIVVDNIEITITASWKNVEGETETEQMRMQIPDWVYSAFRMCGHKPNMLCRACHDFVFNVWYNTCNGRVIDTQFIELGDDGGHWCIPV